MPRKTKHAATRSRTSLWFAPSEPSHVIRPLERISVAVSRPCTIAVTDGGGNEYHRGAAGPEAAFIVGGALGMHTVTAYGSDGRKAATLSFAVDARTEIDDDRGVYKEFLRILHKTMCCYSPTGDIAFEWRGRTYRYFVHWILDHGHTAKGMQFFSPHTAGLVDLLRDVQREDGMIWSNVNKDTGPGWYDTCYGPYGYARRTKGLLLVRQPVENHCEYNFVDAAWRAWKGSGDDAWMKRVLKACTKALDYTVNDRARWSGRFGLLKRGYCIDSWDFQAHDEYEPEFAVPSAMLIDPDRTKFGVFYGDNTGYTFACEQLAEMLEHAGRKKEAARFRLRAAEMHKRLNDIAWNGRFYTHHVEEDPAVKRNFGVDEKSQISFSNAYSLNRNITDEQCKAIIGTYRDLLAHLPPGSPGEWYAIYPPFERGFGKENAKWQYMNGGVHGHAAGELSLGAFEHGYERYGADILERMYRLGKKHGGKIYFAYTGAYPPPPPPQRFAPVDLSALANMDITDAGSDTARRWMDDRAGNDMRNLPVGTQVFAGVPYVIPDPAANDRRAVVGIARKADYPDGVDIPVNAKAGAVYVVHAAGGVGPAGIAGLITFAYADGSTHAQYIRQGKHLANWWFPTLKEKHAGVAWRGPNGLSTDVGVCWAVFENPHPDKEIANIVLSASADGAQYVLCALTLADTMPYVAPRPVSFGGPDNWSAGCCTLALMQGLAGIADAPGTAAMNRVVLSPRWTAAKVGTVALTARYPASKGYVSYQYHHDPKKKTITVTLTGGGEWIALRLLLPGSARKVVSATVGGVKTEAGIETVGSSTYAVLHVNPLKPVTVTIRYR